MRTHASYDYVFIINGLWYFQTKLSQVGAYFGEYLFRLEQAFTSEPSSIMRCFISAIDKLLYTLCRDLNKYNNVCKH